GPHQRKFGWSRKMTPEKGSSAEGGTRTRTPLRAGDFKAHRDQGGAASRPQNRVKNPSIGQEAGLPHRAKRLPLRALRALRESARLAFPEAARRASGSSPPFLGGAPNLLSAPRFSPRLL